MQREISETVALVFVGIAVVILVSRLAGKLFTKIGQPAVVGEIVAGIALGPTVLGALPGDLDQLLFPPDIRPFLSVLAQLGLVLFMFIVGLEVDLSFIRGRERVAASVSLASITLPFALGFGLAFVLYPDHDVVDGEVVAFAAFALFLGVAMSITAFPVLALILTERRMHRIPIGALSLACAAVDDILAWGLLTVVVAVTVGGGFGGVAVLLGLSAVFVALMFAVVRPLLARMVPRYERAGRLTSDLFAVVLIGILGSAFITEEIGIHFIFGAFLFGVVIPRQGRQATALRRDLLERLEQVSTTLLLPVFFVVTGLTVDLSSIGSQGLVELILILAVAIVGKFVGAFAAARLQRVAQRQALALGVLMNTRGLTELVILSVARQLGVLDPTMFSLLVVMAIVTTMMTDPLLRLIYPRRLIERDINDAERALLGESNAHTVLLVVDGVAEQTAIVSLAADLVGAQRPGRVVLASMVSSAPGMQAASGLGVELADLIATGDRLRTLTAAVEERGLEVTVSSRFGGERAADLAALIDQVRPSAVVLPASWAELAAGGGWVEPGRADADVADRPVIVVLGPATGDPGTPVGADVVVSWDNSPDSRAALRLAAAAAGVRGGSVLIAAGPGWRSERRIAGVRSALNRAGVAARPVTAEDRPGLFVGISATGAGGFPAERVRGAEVIGVVAGSEDADRDLDETVAAIVAAEVGSHSTADPAQPGAVAQPDPAGAPD